MHNAARFPLCVFTNNARARSKESAQARAQRHLSVPPPDTTDPRRGRSRGNKRNRKAAVAERNRSHLPAKQAKPQSRKGTARETQSANATFLEVGGLGIPGMIGMPRVGAGPPPLLTLPRETQSAKATLLEVRGLRIPEMTGMPRVGAGPPALLTVPGDLEKPQSRHFNDFSDFGQQEKQVRKNHRIEEY